MNGNKYRLERTGDTGTIVNGRLTMGFVTKEELARLERSLECCHEPNSVDRVLEAYLNA